jgi:hypothetical protein
MIVNEQAVTNGNLASAEESDKRKEPIAGDLSRRGGEDVEKGSSKEDGGGSQEQQGDQAIIASKESPERFSITVKNLLSNAWKRCPAFFSKTTFGIIMILWFVASTLTSYLMYARRYALVPTDQWIFMGNLTDTSISFRIRNEASYGSDAVLQVFPTDDASGIQRFEFVSGEDLVYSATVENLKPSTRYSYRYLREAVNERVFQKGTFRTAPSLESTDSFSFVAGACSWTASNHEIYKHLKDSIEERNLLFMLHLGDMYYEDLSTPSVEERIESIDKSLGAEKQQELFGHLPLAYIWVSEAFVSQTVVLTNSSLQTVYFLMLLFLFASRMTTTF